MIFLSPVGTPVDPRNLLRKFTEMLRSADLPETITIHDLRHAAISTLNNDLGAPIKVAQQVAGHTRVSTTLDIYTDEVDDTMLRDYAERSETLLFGG